MSKKLRGSYYVDGRKSLTLSASNDDKLLDVGFRLVCDPAFEAYRGSMHNWVPDVASKPDRCLVAPLRWHRNLGFRLLYDRGDT